MSLPISRIVNVTPSALDVAGGVNFINGLILSQNSALKAGELREYNNANDVAKDFTTSSNEAHMAAVYFSAYIGASSTPSKLSFYGVGALKESDPQPAPVQLMNDVIKVTQDFTGFTTSWEPSLAEKQEFAQWGASQNLRYWYVCWDSDPQALNLEKSASFGAWLKAQNLDGTTAIYKDPLVAALCLGWMASLNFESTNGRTTLAQRRNRLISPSVTSSQEADALKANGYSFYGEYANGLGRFQFLEDGAVSGQFLWADSYINQIWLNASFQSDLLNLLLNMGQIPYNTQGDALISASVQETIGQALNFGAIRGGVTLTEAQKQQINNAAGTDIAGTVQSRGWYFQPNASTAPADIRASRQSPACKFWYTDGQSVQSIHLSSVEVQ